MDSTVSAFITLTLVLQATHVTAGKIIIGSNVYNELYLALELQTRLGKLSN